MMLDSNIDQGMPPALVMPTAGHDLLRELPFNLPSSVVIQCLGAAT